MFELAPSSGAKRQALDDHFAACLDCRRLALALASTTGTGMEPVVPPETPIKDQTIGRFVLRGELGRGAMGIVYLAHDPELDREVAVKVLAVQSPMAAEEAERLRREGQSLARLSHPNVVTVYEAGTEDKQYYVVMELLEGTTLDLWLAAAERSSSEIIEVFRNAGTGLNAAHEAGLVHRDFKPSNLMVPHGTDAKVTDFGLVRIHDEDSASLPSPEDLDVLRLSLSGSIIGTPAYMAPEQLTQADATAKSDQFAFCVTLYEALCGERPFQGATFSALSASMEGSKDAGVDTSKLHSIRSKARAAIVKGLSVDPEQRHLSMKALLAELAPPKKRWPAGAVALLGASAIALAGVMASASSAETCMGGKAQVAASWARSDRGRIQEAFAAIDNDLARERLVRVQTSLDTYAKDWSLRHHEVCRASERGEQSPSRLDQRMSCLDDKLARFETTIEELALADHDVAVRSLDMVVGLPDPVSCLSLTGAAPPSALRDRIERVERQLNEVETKSLAGQADVAINLAQQADLEAKSIGYHPLKARASLSLARLESSLGNFESAAIHVKESALAAAAAGLPHEQARAFGEQAHLLGVNLAKYDAAKDSADLALALLETGGPAPIAKSEVLLAVSTALYKSGDHDAASKRLQEARAALGSTSSPFARRLLGQIMVSMGQQASTIAQFPKSLEYFDAGLSLFKEIYGSNHADVAMAHEEKGKVLFYLGRNEESQASFAAAIAIRDSIAGDVSHVARLFYEAGEKEGAEAIELLQKAVAEGRQLYGDDHPEVAHLLSGLGDALEDDGQIAAAIKVYREGSRIMEMVHGPQSVEFAKALSDRLHALAVEGKLEEVIADARRVEKILEGSDDIRSQMVSFLSSFILAMAFTDDDFWIEARAQFKRSQAKLASIRELHGDTVMILLPGGFPLLLEFRVAVAEFELQGRTEALKHAHDAARRFVDFEDADQDLVEDVNEWLAEHPLSD